MCAVSVQGRKCFSSHSEKFLRDAICQELHFNGHEVQFFKIYIHARSPLLILFV